MGTDSWSGIRMVFYTDKLVCKLRESMYAEEHGA